MAEEEHHQRREKTVGGFERAASFDSTLLAILLQGSFVFVFHSRYITFHRIDTAVRLLAIPGLSCVVFLGAVDGGSSFPRKKSFCSGQ